MRYSTTSCGMSTTLACCWPLDSSMDLQLVRRIGQRTKLNLAYGLLLPGM